MRIMKREKAMLRKKRGLWIILVVLILAAAGGYYYYNTVYLPTQTPEGPSIQTTKVRQGDLIISATGAGEVVPASEIGLGFDTGGMLTAMAVEVGDKVQVGDVLARIDDFDARKALANAEMQLAKAQSDLDTAENQHEELLEGPSEAEKLELRAAVASAEENLDDLKEDPTEAELDAAEATLASAQENYERLVNGPDATEIEQKDLALSKAKNSLWSSQMSRDSKGGQRDRDSGAYNQAQVSVLNAEISVRLAEISLAEIKEPATPAELQEALAKVTQAQERLEELHESPTKAELSEAEARLAKARENLDGLLTSPSEEDIATSTAQVEQARLSLAQAKLNMEAAQKDLAQTVLVAPMDGTIMEVTAQAGEKVGNASIITLADLSQPLIEIYVDETDMDMIRIGYEVEVVLDAMPDEIFKGRVVQMDPSLVRMEGVETIHALVQLDPDSFAKPQSLPMGLSATVDVIAGRAEGVLLVPVEALRELGPDEYAVFVMEDGQLKLHVVEVGLMDFTYAEIRSGLKLGDTVSTGIVETR